MGAESPASGEIVAALTVLMRHGWEPLPPANQKELIKQRDELRSIVAEFAEGEDGPCRLDHHGYCQEHFLTNGECIVKRGRRALALEDTSGTV